MSKPAALSFSACAFSKPALSSPVTGQKSTLPASGRQISQRHFGTFSMRAIYTRCQQFANWRCLPPAGGCPPCAAGGLGDDGCWQKSLKISDFCPPRGSFRQWRKPMAVFAGRVYGRLLGWLLAKKSAICRLQPVSEGQLRHWRRFAGGGYARLAGDMPGWRQKSTICRLLCQAGPFQEGWVKGRHPFSTRPDGVLI